jgi:hypothetical protein
MGLYLQNNLSEEVLGIKDFIFLLGKAMLNSSNHTLSKYYHFENNNNYLEQISILIQKEYLSSSERYKRININYYL